MHVARILPLFFCLLPIVFAHAGQFDIADTPDWVIGIGQYKPEKVPESQISEGVYYVVLDRQVNVGPDQTHIYTRIVKKVLNPRGVETASQIYINYDPSYEQLSLHRVRIDRNGSKLNQLDREKITVIQRESDLERRLYNGQKTASIILEDTRPGDTIEYAYTISGSNPVFKGRFMDEVDTSWSVPLAFLHYRWYFSNGHPVFHKTFNCKQKLIRRDFAKAVEYRYTDERIGATITDEDLPAWYRPYPSIQLAQFRDWADVGRWGASLYPMPQSVSPDLQRRIDELKREKTPTDKIAKASCLVQNEIRYLGMEIGAGSYRPSAPEITYRRKFGDCKDKTILLCTLLNNLGIHARPALVNTRLKRTISNLLPSPLLFNHVIACVQSEGKTYWIDPTADCQKIPMDKQYPALYGKALVLEKGTRELIDTGQEELFHPSKEIHEQFDLTQGINQPATFSVKSVFRGREADRLRYQIKSKGLEQTAKSYLNFYASDYPSITERQPMTAESDPETNDLVVSEHYHIPAFWQQSEDKKDTLAVFHAREFYSLFQQPATTIRTMPIGLSHPHYVIHRITVKLPEPWNIKPEKGRVENDAMVFTDAVEYANNELTLKYSYQSKQDYVPADKSPEYISDIKQIKDQIGYQLSYSQENHPAGTNWLMVGAALVGIVAAMGFLIAAWFYDPEPMGEKSLLDGADNLTGIGGWLILVMIGLFARPLIIFKGLVDLMPVFSQSYWHGVKDSIRPGFDIAFKLLVAGEVAANIIFIVMLLALLILFFKKRSSFPYLFIGITVAQFLFLILDALLAQSMLESSQLDPAEISETMRGALFTIIWCLYMLKSRRVRRTFQRRRGRQVRVEPVGEVMLEAGSQN